MFIICANTIEEAERDLLAMKQAVATSKPIGLGGDTPEDVEQAMKCLRNALSAHAEPCTCGCPCRSEVEEEEDEWVECCECCSECEYADECDDHEYEEEEDDLDEKIYNAARTIANLLGLTS